MAMQESGEMYLETIYILSQQSPAVRGIDVGDYMGYSKPSVSRAIGLLKKSGLVFIDDSGYIKLQQPIRVQREGNSRKRVRKKRSISTNATPC